MKLELTSGRGRKIVQMFDYIFATCLVVLAVSFTCWALVSVVSFLWSLPVWMSGILLFIIVYGFLKFLLESTPGL